jgi:hypothetical protein
LLLSWPPESYTGGAMTFSFVALSCTVKRLQEVFQKIGCGSHPVEIDVHGLNAAMLDVENGWAQR